MRNDWFEIGALVFCGVIFLAATSADPGSSRQSWELNSWAQGDQLKLEMKRSTLTSRSTWSSTYPLSDLQGLTRDQLRSAKTPVKFTVDRDAGSFVFEGTLIAGFGGGDFHFVANPKYIAEMQALGFSTGAETDMMRFALSDITLSFARQVKDAGIRVHEIGELLKLRDHGVSIEMIREIQAMGYKDLDVDDVTRLQDHGVNTSLLRAAMETGRTYTSEDITKMHDHGIDPGFLRGIRTSGWSGSADDLTRLRDHGVTPGLVKSLVDAGFKDIGADDITRLQDHGVDAQYVARLKTSGFQNLNIEQIVKLKEHGID